MIQVVVFINECRITNVFNTIDIAKENISNL